MADEWLTDFVAEAGDDIDHTGRESDFFEQGRKLERRGRGELRRLDDHGVAGCKRRSEFVGGQQQRRVPGRDGSDYAERLMPGEVEHLVLVGRDDGALDLVGEAAEVKVPLR